jgi:ketosteroid isomerase-like protein
MFSWPALSNLHGYGPQALEAEVSPEDIRDALARFIAAFENLDWAKFRPCFSNHATIFHPAPPNIKRIDSREEFDKAWLEVFERIKRNSGRTSPPFMKLEPADVRIERLSLDVSLVTFHLFDGNITSRRTLVFQNENSSWKIAHIHASNIGA